MYQRLALITLRSIALMSAGPAPPPGRRPKGRTLKKGEQASACVQARLRWNHTCIRLERQGKYLITAKGVWWDASSEHGPKGDSSPKMRMWERFRRMPHEDWFKLICALESRKETAFPF